MNPETKRCPYCAEEINKDAIKCKHCGEFLNSEKTLATSSHAATVEQTIAQQDFTSAMIIGAVSIILSFVSILYDDDNSKLYWKITIFSLFVNIRLWFYFRSYLENFNATRAIILANWNIAMVITMELLGIIFKVLPDGSASEEWQDTDTLGLWLFAFFIVIVIASIVVYVKLGISLQKIKNDFVGLLKELGMTIAYLLPIVILLIIIGTVMENKVINLLATALDNVSTVIMIMLFARARKFVKRP